MAKKKRLRLSGKAGGAKIAYDEAKHKRDLAGKYANKPGVGNDAPKKARVPAGKHSEAIKAQGKTSGIKPGDTIKVHVAENPKKAGSASAADFAKYKNDMTVAEFKAAVGPKAAAHLSHDIKKGYVSVHAPGSLPKPKLQLSKEQYVLSGKTSGVKGDDVIKLHPGSKVGEMLNPKKMGSASADDFAKYRDEMTVDDYVKAVGDKKKALAHIKWDTDKGFVSVHNKYDLADLRTGKLPPPSAASVKSGPPGTKPKTKVADLKADDSLMMTSAGKPNPYKEGTDAWIKYKAFEMQHGKPHTLASYMSTKALTDGPKKAALQQLIDDGHVKLVPKGQVAAVAAAKAASPVPIHKSSGIGTSGKPALPSFKSDDARWSKAVGYKDLSTGSKGYDAHISALKEVQAGHGLRYVGNENKAVGSYVHSGYIGINSSLRAGDPPGTYAKQIDALIAEAPRFAQDTYLYRGLKQAGLNDMPPPPGFTDLGFSSTSMNPNVSSGFSSQAGAKAAASGAQKTFFRIRVPKGYPGIEVSIKGSREANLGGEAEVLLPRGTRYKYINRTEEVLENQYGWTKVSVVEVEVVRADGSVW